METEQNFANHRSFDKPFMIGGLGILVTAILALVNVIRAPGLASATLLVFALSAVPVTFRIRAYAAKVQDRVIRLEMRLRLKPLLTGDLKGKGDELAVSQLIGLRFASDAEIPELTKKILDEDITKADEVKKLVKDWQADHLRV